MGDTTMRNHFRLPAAVLLACTALAAGAHDPAAHASQASPAPPAAAPAAADAMDFEQARMAANQDEARLDGDQVADLAKAQGDYMKRWVGKCTARIPTRELTPIGLVMELDAKGRVVRTWQDTDSAVANCLVAGLRSAVFYAPPKAPFMTAMNMSWSN
jgi:hypothetical protein